MRMARGRLRRRLIAAGCALVSLTFGLSGVIGASPASADTEITGTGSSFAALAILQWASDLDSYGLNVNYSTQSSVVGLQQFANQSVNFGASEMGYSTNQAQPPSFAYQYLPDVAGGIAFAYNLTDNNGRKITTLRLSPPTLVGIWTDKIQTWNDPAIAADNPGVALPDIPIKVIYRSDGAGESYILSWYFSYMFPTEWATYLKAIDQAGAPLSAYYPVWQPGTPLPPGYNFNNWLGQSGSDAAAHYVSQSGSDGAITYVETSWALYYNLAYAYVQNPSHNWVQPGYLNVAVALEKAVLYSDLEQNLDGVFTNPLPASYPLSSYSYILTEEGEVNPAIGAGLSQFIYFLGCAGQSQTIQLGYAPLPPNLVEDDFAAAERLAGHLSPPPLTAAGCKNPYIDGKIPLPGEPIVEKGGGPPPPPSSSSTVPGSQQSGQPGTTVPGSTSSHAGGGSSAGSSSSGGSPAAGSSAGGTAGPQNHKVTVTSWSAPTDVDGDTPLDAASCPTADFCAVVDSKGHVISETDGHWAHPATVDGSTALDAVSCATATFCVAVDRTGHAVTFKGSAWSKPTDVDGTTALRAVSCPSASLCVATDATGRALLYNGTKWSKPADIDGDHALESVSCPGDTSCVAVDAIGRALDFNGRSWSVPVAIDAGKDLSAVSCSSTSSCEAADASGDTVAYSGNRWVPAHKVDPSHTLSSVSCATGLCAAVDSAGRAFIYRPSTWGAATDIDGTTGLRGVSCPTANFCLAVDGLGRALTYASKVTVQVTQAATTPQGSGSSQVTTPNVSPELADAAGALKHSGGWSAAVVGWAGGLFLLCAIVPSLAWWRSRRRTRPGASA